MYNFFLNINKATDSDARNQIKQLQKQFCTMAMEVMQILDLQTFEKDLIREAMEHQMVKHVNKYEERYNTLAKDYLMLCGIKKNHDIDLSDCIMPVSPLYMDIFGDFDQNRF
jgi:hypothetical protein